MNNLRFAKGENNMLRKSGIAAVALAATLMSPAQSFADDYSKPFVWEVGARYWYSVGRNKYDYSAGALLVSRLTYEDMAAHSGEAFFRVDHNSGVFLKGFIGAGAFNSGRLIDEDFPPAIAPYSRTHSDLKGNLGYATVDVGYTLYDSTRGYHHGSIKDEHVSHGMGLRLGAFVGYNYWKEKADAYGCTQIAGNPFVCPPGAVLSSDKVITEKDRWNSLRLGVVADVMITERLKLTGEAAYLITDQKALDIHYFTFGPDPAKGDGQGFQLEAILAYAITDSFNVGVGGRWWHLNTEATDAFAQQLKYDTDRYGVFLQGSYKFH